MTVYSARREADLVMTSTGSNRNAQPTMASTSEWRNGMDQQEADDKHHRAGYAMN